MKRAVFPGSFDPITLGHCEIIKKAINIFDEVIVAVGSNPDKKYHFSISQRLEFIKNEFGDNAKILVKSYDGLTADLCKKIDRSPTVTRKPKKQMNGELEGVDR